MGTGGVIARRTPTGFEGRYHHWDSYPEGLGKTLYRLCRGHFKGDYSAMLRVLIDEHPGGWSTINKADFSLEPGFDGPGPSCYCHGARSEKMEMLTHETAAESGCEFAYVIHEDGKMAVMSSFNPDGGKMIGFFGCGNPDAEWYPIGTVDLTSDEEPDWSSLPAWEDRGGKQAEGGAQ